MSGPDYHASTHRPKGKGGTDPVPIELPYIYGSNQGTPQTVTADDELNVSLAITNDHETYRRTGDGLFIIRDGVYQVWSMVRYNGSDIAVERTMYASLGTLSGGPLSGLGTELGQNHFAAGQGQQESSLGSVEAVNTISKSVLNHMAMGVFLGFDYANDPPRVAVILTHNGTDYHTYSGLASTFTIIRVAELGSVAHSP